MIYKKGDQVVVGYKNEGLEVVEVLRDFDSTTLQPLEPFPEGEMPHVLYNPNTKTKFHMDGLKHITFGPIVTEIAKQREVVTKYELGKYYYIHRCVAGTGIALCTADPTDGNRKRLSYVSYLGDIVHWSLPTYCVPVDEVVVKHDGTVLEKIKT